ncbi:hypothetical protein ACC713_33990 [Rhizobium johnstonii]|uniref:hypothetical protein n=1 Tax=Rhizobium johnstonii TaxID=3019933 RepID=UPI003F94F055
MKDVLPYDLPQVFLGRAMAHMNREQVAAVSTATEKYETLSEILEQACIPVVYCDDDRAPEYFMERQPQPATAPRQGTGLR